MKQKRDEREIKKQKKIQRKKGGGKYETKGSDLFTFWRDNIKNVLTE
jgi:cytoplasmic iron level regulating protein YaaA (DUF328/UPF0246 family)